MNNKKKLIENNNRKKLIFILGSPRSGTTLLLSYLCGLENTKILYETKTLTMLGGNINERAKTACMTTIANYFDSLEKEIVIEKTPEHVFYLEDIEKLREICKRDIHVIYLLRPPVPTIVSLIKASSTWKGVDTRKDILGYCEKYEESLVNIYHNLVTKTPEGYKYQIKKPWKSGDSYVASRETSDGQVIPMSFVYKDIVVPYSFQVTYQDITENTYSTLYDLLVTGLHLDLSKSDIENLITNRIENTLKVLPIIKEEVCHVNVLKSTKEVTKLRREVVDRDVTEYWNEIKYIRNYFEHPKTKESLYDLITKKQLVDIQENPLVTIIVPLYNKEKYIVDTLNSLLDQTYESIRVIVIDDASTDKSLEIVENYYRNLPYSFLQEKMCIVKRKINQGVSSTRNLGLNGNFFQDSISNKPDIISFCDADDIWDSRLVERSVATFKRYPYVDCVYSRVLLLNKEGTLTKNHSKICNGYVYEDALEYNFLTCGSNIFIKASIMKEYGILFNPEYNGCEDWDFLIQLTKVATFKCTKEYLVKYRQSYNSLSTNREFQVTNGKNILENYIVDRQRFKSVFTRLFLYYFSIKNIRFEHIKDLDFRFILRVVVSKLKSFVKSYLP